MARNKLKVTVRLRSYVTVSIYQLQPIWGEHITNKIANLKLLESQLDLPLITCAVDQIHYNTEQ